MSAGRWLFAGLTGAAALAVAIYFRPASPQQPPASRPVAQSGYVDAFTCSGCHAEIWNRFRKTGMGRSMTRAAAATMPPGFAERRRFYHSSSDRYYTLLERNGKFFQRRHQIGPSGAETNVFEREIHFVVGSGNHARTFLHRAADGRLYELPLAWYAEGGGTWAMNPGYDHANHPDYRREVPHECIACHTAYPEVKPGADMIGREPVFPGKIPEGIDCQRCHGPGRAHIEAAAGKDIAAIRKAIVNPARLTPALQLDVCMQCHLETTSSRLPHAILRWERGAFSFRPGEPLAAYSIHFDHAPGTGRDDKFEIASHAYRLRKSACWLKSEGRLTCTTCHDPHESADRARPLQACAGCHLPALSKVRGHPHGTDCIACHMPRRRTEDVVHVVMTDHYIQRRKPAMDLLAPRKERPDTEEEAYQGPVSFYGPGDLARTPGAQLYLAVAQVKQFSNLKQGVPELESALALQDNASAPAHLELAEAYAHLGQVDQAIRHYQTAVRAAPDFRPAHIGLAQVLSKQGQNDRAADILTETLKEKTPSDHAVWNTLGLVRIQQGRVSEGIEAFRKAIALQPEYAEAYNNCAGALVQSGDRSNAIVMAREAIRIDPSFAAAHLNLARLLDNSKEAEYHYKKAVYHGRKYAAAYLAYGQALAGQERFAEAAKQFEAATGADPSLAEAFASWGDMLSLQGKPSQAIPHYKRALELRPDLETARVGLQMATGNVR